MEWYYAGKHDEQLGPLAEDDLRAMLERKELDAATPVWNDSMEDWCAVKDTVLAESLPKSTPPPLERSSRAPKPPGAAAFDRDDRLVYPPNPPRSPHMAWINLLGSGLAQIVFGKTALGITCIGATTVFNLLYHLFGTDYDEPTGFGVFVIVLSLILFIGTMVDAYMTGNRLREGQPVKRWQLFPLRNPPQN